MNVALFVPTCNAGAPWREWLEALRAQTRQPDRLLLIDSSSDDDTPSLAREYGFEVRIIPRREFNHGGTRQLGVEWASDADVIVMLSHDARFANNEAIEKLVACFENPGVGAAYGRQLAYPDASLIDVNAREFNYPAESSLRGLEDAPRLRFRTIFFSNAFSAYRRSALMEVGGFKSVITMEDEYAAARLVLANYKLAYCAEAQVYHSHFYSLWQEFTRYFDFGVFHAREAWIREYFGQAEGEGMRLVRTQMQFLWERRPSLVIPAIFHMAAKLAGMRLGESERFLPTILKRRLSMNKTFWLPASR